MSDQPGCRRRFRRAGPPKETSPSSVSFNTPASAHPLVCPGPRCPPPPPPSQRPPRRRTTRPRRTPVKNNDRSNSAKPARCAPTASARPPPNQRQDQALQAKTEVQASCQAPVVRPPATTRTGPSRLPRERTSGCRQRRQRLPSTLEPHKRGLSRARCRAAERRLARVLRSDFPLAFFSHWRVRHRHGRPASSAPGTPNNLSRLERSPRIIGWGTAPTPRRPRCHGSMDGLPRHRENILNKSFPEESDRLLTPSAFRSPGLAAAATYNTDFGTPATSSRGARGVETGLTARRPVLGDEGPLITNPSPPSLTVRCRFPSAVAVGRHRISVNFRSGPSLAQGWNAGASVPWSSSPWCALKRIFRRHHLWTPIEPEPRLLSLRGPPLSPH